MEGHRGEPRSKPPFPAAYGLHGKPTLMNSVETFAHVPVEATGLDAGTEVTVTLYA
jgi:NADH:ubiquinone oxidoreductase subunit F (NADH-binding)